jgi:hypothetical protein
MATAIHKAELVNWVHSALVERGGQATIVQIAKHIWENHEAELRGAGNLFYTWQYDMRWAATELRKRGKIVPYQSSNRGIWQLK